MRTAAMADGLPTETAGVWAAVTGFFGTALGAVGLWLANRLMGKAAFQTAINSGFKELTEQLRSERADLRRALDDERIAWASERAQLRGEIINLTQTIQSLENLLIRHGIDIPQPHRPAPLPMIIEGEQS